MGGVTVDLQGHHPPAGDGDIREYINAEARGSDGYFDPNRKVIFINGMNNSPIDHAESALALSLVQMCAVIGVYNQTVSGWRDFWQCVADKNQFNGPVSFSAKNTVALATLASSIRSRTPVTERMTEAVARAALSRNPAQVALFDLLRRPDNRNREIFAHSQGNLILSNALQAIEAVDGAGAIGGRIVHTFGSPAVNWPAGLEKYQHAFTFDPVTWLAGLDTTFSISKVGMPATSKNPITHAFLEYLQVDPAFIVNRFRVGGLGLTFKMDEEGLARCLAAMGTNTPRVRSVFEHLRNKHSSDSDDVAEHYVSLVRGSPAVVAALKANRDIVSLLIAILDSGVVFGGEQRAIEFLQPLLQQIR